MTQQQGGGTAYVIELLGQALAQANAEIARLRDELAAWNTAPDDDLGDPTRAQHPQ